MQNLDADFNNCLMLAVAQRIAAMAQTDALTAEQDYQQHVRDMSEDERHDFDEAIVHFAILFS